MMDSWVLKLQEHSKIVSSFRHLWRSSNQTIPEFACHKLQPTQLWWYLSADQKVDMEKPSKLLLLLLSEYLKSQILRWMYVGWQLGRSSCYGDTWSDHLEKNEATRRPHRSQSQISTLKKRVCHTMALPFTLKSKYLKAKEELWKLKYFSMQKYNVQKIL
jgi:hypothetical protein